MIAMPPDLVIFDCDGVLVDSELVSAELLQDDLAGRGLHMSRDDILREFIGGTMQCVGERAAGMGADIPEGWVERIYERMYARLALGAPKIDGVESVLDRLDAAGVPYVVGSNGSLRKMEITLGQHPELQARFEGRIYSAHVHGVAKPDPGLFLIAAGEMGVDPERCAVVDDSPAGCEAARRAGMACFGYAERDDGARLIAEGAKAFHSMEELPELLGV